MALPLLLGGLFQRRGSLTPSLLTRPRPKKHGSTEILPPFIAISTLTYQCSLSSRLHTRPRAATCRFRPQVQAGHPSYGAPRSPPGHAVLQVGPSGSGSVPQELRSLHPDCPARQLEQEPPHRCQVSLLGGKEGPFLLQQGGRGGHSGVVSRWALRLPPTTS